MNPYVLSGESERQTAAPIAGLAGPRVTRKAGGPGFESAYTKLKEQEQKMIGDAAASQADYYIAKWTGQGPGFSGGSAASGGGLGAVLGGIAGLLPGLGGLFKGGATSAASPFNTDLGNLGGLGFGKGGLDVGSFWNG